MKCFSRIFLFLILSLFCYSETNFEIIALGVRGGLDEGNLSSYLIRNTEENNYLALDAGTLLPGIKKANIKNSFSNVILDKNEKLSKEGYIFKNLIKGYFISHGHIDHVAGLVIDSTDDTKKNIYSLPSVKNIIENNYFNWKAWPNFGNEGEGFKLSQYTYKVQEVGKEFVIEQTKLKGQIFPLSHSNYESSVILINSNGYYFAYFGDTGPDEVEKSKMLDNIWKELAPKIKNKKLKAIMIETSFTNDVEDKDLFGHLTPKWLTKELENLSVHAGKNNMKDLNIIVTHVKPSLNEGVNKSELIKKELEELNKLGVKFHMIEQGDRLVF